MRSGTLSIIATAILAAVASSATADFEDLTPEGYQLAYVNKATINDVEYTRVGFIDTSTGDMVDLVLDPERNQVDVLPSKESRNRIMDDVTQAAIDEILIELELPMPLEKQSMIDLDIEFSVPSVPWAQSEPITGMLVAGGVSRDSMSINGEEFTEEAHRKIQTMKEQARQNYIQRKSAVVRTVREAVGPPTPLRC